jgi:uroporphyrinogen-III synthase
VFPKKNATLISRTRDTPNLIEKCSSSPQVERLFEVAREAGIAKQFDEVLQHTRIAAIGPIVEQTLRLHGVTAVLRPETSFHLKPFVRAIGHGARSDVDQGCTA